MRRACTSTVPLLKSRARHGPSFGYYVLRIVLLESVGRNPARQQASYRRRADAERAAEHYRIEANPDRASERGITFGVLLDKYIADEIPQRHSTKTAYESLIRTHIRPKWKQYAIAEVKPLGLNVWMKAMKLSAKSKNNIKWLAVEHLSVRSQVGVSRYGPQSSNSDLCERRNEARQEADRALRRAVPGACLNI
jgi:hypothetical protein